MRQISMILLCLSVCLTQARAQKMLLLEETGKLRSTRFYVGQNLQYRLVGRENYWYTRKITDILAESNAVVLGENIVEVEDIAAIRVKRKSQWKRFGPKLVIFGAQLSLATGLALADKRWEYAPLFLVSAASTTFGMYLITDQKIKLNQRKRLLATEIRFSDQQEIPVPPEK
jgi:hypothetical protein